MHKKRSRIIDILKTAKEHTVVTVELIYNEGGMNYWNYKQEHRGFYLHARLETRKDGWIEFSMGNGIKQLLLIADRFNQKTLDTLPIDPAIEAQLIDYVVSKNQLSFRLPVAA